MASPAPAPSRLERWVRPVRLGLALFAAVTAIAFVWRLWVVLAVGQGSVVGVDRGIYKEAALRWAGGGFWYYPEQLAGPYTIIQGHVLYPPTALAWLVPAAYLPDALWWGLPICVIAAIVWHHRPTIWAWPVMGLCLSTFWSVEIIASGNPGLWITMFAALGTIWRPAFALVLLKPSLGPIALLGARSRGWWVLVGAFVLVSLALLPMWIDYVHVLLNGRGSLAVVWYSIRDVPLVSVPLVAWAARTRSDGVDGGRLGVGRGRQPLPRVVEPPPLTP
jgi:hypothetical protein